MEANSEINGLQQGEGNSTPLKPKGKFYRCPHLALALTALLLAGAAAAQESTIERDLTREEKNNALREEYARRVEAGALAAMPLVYPPPDPEPVKVAAVKPVARPDVCRRHGIRSSRGDRGDADVNINPAAGLTWNRISSQSRSTKGNIQMRFLLMLVFCLFAAPAWADTLHIFTSGMYKVYGDYGLDPAVMGTFDFHYTQTVIPGDYDDLNGPYYGSFGTAYVGTMGQIEACEYSQAGSGCARSLYRQPVFWISEEDNKGWGYLPVQIFVSGLNTTITDVVVDVYLPDGFSLNAPVPAVPEASTWTMLIAGFAGIGFIACRRRKLMPGTSDAEQKAAALARDQMNGRMIKH